jgi:hypothetical protein
MQFVYKLFPPKWRILTMKTLSYKLKRLSICSFDQIISLLFSPFQSCFIYHVLLFVDDDLLYRVTGPLLPPMMTTPYKLLHVWNCCKLFFHWNNINEIFFYVPSWWRVAYLSRPAQLSDATFRWVVTQHGKASIAILVSCNFLYRDSCQFTH